MRTAQFTPTYQSCRTGISYLGSISAFQKFQNRTYSIGRLRNSGDVYTCPMSVMSLTPVKFVVSIMALISEIHGVHDGLDECDAPGVHDDLTIMMSAVSMMTFVMSVMTLCAKEPFKTLHFTNLGTGTNFSLSLGPGSGTIPFRIHEKQSRAWTYRVPRCNP